MTDPWEAVEYPPEFKRAAKEYVQPKSFLRRGLYPALEPKKAMPSWEDMISGKADAEIDMPMAPAISLPMARLGGRSLMRRRWAPGTRSMSDTARRELKSFEKLDMDDIIKNVPEGLWKRIKRFTSTSRHPKYGTDYGGLHTLEPSAGLGSKARADIWVNPHGSDPIGVTAHEVGHEASDAFLEWSRKEFLGNFRPGAPGSGAKFSITKPGPFAKLRKEWGEIAADMKHLETRVNPKGHGATELYRLNPDEIFANRFSDAMVEGMGFNEAVKFGVHEVRANLSRSRDAVNKINKYLNWSDKTPPPIAY